MSILHITPAFTPDIPKTKPVVAPVNAVASAEPPLSSTHDLAPKPSFDHQQLGYSPHHDSVDQARKHSLPLLKEKPHKPSLTAMQVMSSVLICIRKNDSFKQAATIMQQHDIDHLVVVSEHNDLLGLIDSEAIIQHGKDSPVAITNYLPQTLQAAKPETPIADIAQYFITYNTNAIAVIDDQLKPIGLVCRTDLLKILMQGNHIERWA